MKSLILLFSMFISLLSCSNNSITENEENSCTENPENAPIYGEWNLIKYEHGFSPTYNFDFGAIIWNFQQNGTVNIKINDSITLNPVKSRGNYCYSLKGNKILLDNVEYDFTIENNLLIISNDPSSDGFRLEFSKINCTENPENAPIYGEWNLIKYEHGFSPTYNFDFGAIIWNFQEKGAVNIKINDSITLNPVKSRGNYCYSLKGNKILLDNVEYDFTIENNLLIISNDPSSDGFRLEFSKIKCTENPENAPIYGEWNLIKYEHGFSPTYNFDFGAIIWNFQEKGAVNIKINDSITLNPVKSRGNYCYSLKGNKILLDNVEYDFTIENNLLIISNDLSSDGFRLEFSKINCTENPENTPIYGEWNLIKYEHGFSPTYNFDFGAIIWNFQEKGAVNIKINDSITLNPVKSRGNYCYSLSDNKILLDNVEYDFTIENNLLIISNDPSSDGFRLEFSKINCTENPENAPIYGEWNLIKYEHGFSPTYNFDFGAIIWNFQQNGTVNIKINDSITLNPIKSRGNYCYSLSDNKILLDNVEYDFTIENNLLIISNDPSSDGFRLEFSKIN